MRWLEQTRHTEVEEDDGRLLSVSESAQMAWTGTPALEEMPGKEDRA